MQAAALAADDTGTLYAYDNDSRHLYRLSSVSGNATDLGEIIDPDPRVYPAGHVNAGLPFEDIRYNASGMAYDDLGDRLVMIATLVDIAPDPDPPIDPVPPDLPAGPFLIFITPGGAVVRGPALTQGGIPYTGTVSDLTYHNWQLWGTEGGRLIRINPNTGVVTDLPDIANVSGITGLTDLDGQLYAAAGNSVYEVANGGGTTALYGNLTRNDITDLASDGETLWGLYSSGGETRLTVIDTEPTEPADIFSVFIAEADQYTILSFTTITGTTEAPNWTAYQIWDSANTAGLSAAANGNINLWAPAGSGGVLIGGRPTGAGFQHVAVDEVGAWTNRGFGGGGAADSFAFTVNDGTVDSDEVAVTVVTPWTQDPIAQDGEYGIEVNGTLNGTVLATDATTAPPDVLTYATVALPSNGTLTAFNPATGDFTYDPNPGYIGADSFTFEADDTWVDSNIATVSIVVHEVGGGNNAPVGQPLEFSVDENYAGEFTPPDPNAELTYDGTLLGTDEDADGMTFTITRLPTHGTITAFDTNTGAFTYERASLAVALPVGVFPGGDVYPGIFTAGPMAQIIDDASFLGLGNSVASLASDSAGDTYAVDNQSHQLMAANYDPASNTTTAAAVGSLVDAADATWRHDNVTALDFDSGDVLYGISAVITDTVPGAPAPPDGTWLVTINTATGVVTRVVQLSVRGDTTNINISAIAFNSIDTIYAVDANTNTLATINPGTGAVVLLDEILDVDTAGRMPDIVGLDFRNDYLYALSASGMYAIDVDDATASGRVIDPVLQDPGTGLYPPLGPTGLSDHTALDYNVANTSFWSVTFDGGFKLVYLDEANPVLDMGRVLVGGTVAGQLKVSGSLDVFDVGHVWGNVDIGYDANNIIVHTDYARTQTLPDYPDNALVNVGGVLRELDVYGTMYGTVNTEGGLNITERDPSLVNYNEYPIWEMEYRPYDNPYDIYYENNNALAVRGHWALDGQLMTVNDDSQQDAQFLYNDSGDTVLWGWLAGQSYNPNDEYDYYAVSLLAGQTITVDAYYGHALDPREAMMTFFDVGLAVGVYNADMNYLASVGFETYEDIGIGSVGWTQEPLTFTAPQAGVYTLVVAQADRALVSPPTSGANYYSWDYTLFINGGPQVSLGAVDVKGDYDPRYYGDGAKYEYDIAVQNGDFGAFDVDGTSRVTRTFVIGGGDLVSYRADQIGISSPGWAGDTIVSDSNIGLVEGVNSFVTATIVAGATDADYNNNAVIQNIISAGVLRADAMYTSPTGDLFGVWSSGGVGSVDVASDIHLSTDFTIDYDAAGPGARLDYLHAGGDWGSRAGFPEFFHGPGSDIGYVIIDGTVHGQYGGFTGPIEPVTVTTGIPTVIEDDGGGRFQINPVFQVDEDGNLETVDDGTGTQVPVPSAYTYLVIPVRSLAGGPKIGGVLTNLRLDGPTRLTNFGVGNVVDVGRIEMNGFGGFNIGGAGPVNTYYIEGTEVDSFTNATLGALVSAQFGGGADYALRMDLHGDLGHVVGEAGQWLLGIPPAPADSQIGWFGRRINGARIDGDLEYLALDGFLGDLFVTGEAVEIIVNRDHMTTGDRFDGVTGVVEADVVTRLNVGQGLWDDGSGDHAMAAVLARDTIHQVIIDGSGYVLNGSVLAVNEIHEVFGYNGAICTAIIAATDLDSYHPWIGGVPDTGWVGTVRFAGAGGAITGAEVFGQYIGTVEATIESDGIDLTYITGTNAPADTMAIQAVLGGGPGVNECWIAANGGAIGIVRGTGPGSDVRYNDIDSTESIIEVSGRTIFGNTISAPGRMERMWATQDISANPSVSVGALIDLRAGGDFSGNTFEIATEVQSVVIGGHFHHSDLILQGPEGTYLGVLDVMGNISGRIEVAGSIGAIYSRLGLISADIITSENPVGADIRVIYARLGYTGSLSIAGNLGYFYCYGTLGANPEDVANYLAERMDIAGNVAYLGVFTLTGAPSHCYTTINIGGNATTLYFAGSLLGDLTVNGDVTVLIVLGDLGGMLNLPAPSVSGSVMVHGTLYAIQLGAGASVIGNLTTGGNLYSLVLVDGTGVAGNGDIIGNVTSLHGQILRVTVVNGAVAGNISGARGVGPVVISGSLADPANVTGNITSEFGGVQMVHIVNGFLDGDVRALGGDLGGLYVTNGDVLAGNVIESVAFVRAVQVTNGSFAANLAAGVGMTSFVIVNGNLTGNVVVSGSATTFVISGGNVVGSDIWINGKLSTFVVVGDMVNATLRTLSDMTIVNITHDIINSQIIGGYRPAVGADPQRVHSANLAALYVGRNFDATSVVALGVNPGDNDFTTLGDNTPAPGVSRLGYMWVGGAANGLVTTDSGWGTIPAGLATQLVELAPPAMPGAPLVLGWNPIGADGVWIYYVPGSATAVANYDLPTGQITVNDPNPGLVGSTFIVNGTGAPKAVHVVGGDDDRVAALIYQGNAQAGNVAIDGPVGTFTANAAAVAPAWTLPGGVTYLGINAPVNNAVINAGAVYSARIMGNYTGDAGGMFTADEITASFYVFGELSAPVTTTIGRLGGIYTLGLLAADITAQYGLGFVIAMAGIGRNNGLGAPDPVDGDILVRTGDLGSLTSYADVLANIEVPAGKVNAVAIYNGVFGSVLGDNALRSLSGINSFVMVGGDANGLISTDGWLYTMVIVNGELHSRVRVGQHLHVVNVDAMRGALVTSNGHIYNAIIRGNMFLSDIVSGFDPADAGYDAAAGGNQANVRFDGRTFPATWNTVANADSLGGGDVWNFYCSGDVEASSVVAGISPGPDGWFGTEDDLARGTGYVRVATIYGTVFGSVNPAESYGIFAASGSPTVNVIGAMPFVGVGNFGLGDLAAVSGAPRVTDVQMFPNRVVITFSGEMDYSSFNDGWLDPTRPTTIDLIASQDSFFGPAEADDVSISDTVPHTLAYDEITRSLTLRLDGGTWETLNRGTNFLLLLDGQPALTLDNQIVDDDDAGYSEVGPDWADDVHQAAHQGDARVVAAPGGNTATWDLAVSQAGTYAVYATWVADVTNATNAAFTVYDGVAVEEVLAVDQQVVPNDVTVAGQNWELLGTYDITSGQISVDLADAGANGRVYADAILVDGPIGFVGEFAVTNQRGVVLDGEFSEFTHRFPSGDGIEGGHFRYRTAYGDPGDTVDTATHLTAGVPMLQYNDILVIEQEIGDSDNPVAEEDVDWFAIDVKAGDILYCWSPTDVWVYPTPELVEQVNGQPDPWDPDPALPQDPSQILEPSLSTSGMRAIADGTVYVTVSGLSLVEDYGWWGGGGWWWGGGGWTWVFEGFDLDYIGPYALNILLFNDGNSNFTFDDATQVPTPVTWVADEARPSEQDQEIIAPDDVDIFDLGALPAFTRLDIQLDTTLIGSELISKMAVFNSSGDLVGSIVFGDEIEGTDVGGISLEVTLEGSVLTRAADNYFLAVAGMSSATLPDDPTYTGLYDVVVTRTFEPAPVFAPQLVYLNFNGGSANWVPEAFADPRAQVYQEALLPQTFGFRAIEATELFNAAVTRIEEIFGGFTNIQFTTIRPLGGEYTTVFFANNLSPDLGTLGIAESIDTDNSDHTDEAVVYCGEYANIFHADFGNTPTDVGTAIGNTGAHELSHVLGLNHVQNDFSLAGGTWVIDDADLTGYNEVGTDWIDDLWNWDAYDSNGRMVVAPGVGNNEAWWELHAPGQGVYQVYATWADDAGNAVDAPYTVYDGLVPEGTVDVDQTAAPNDFTYDGQMWESLGTYSINSGRIRVRLTDAAAATVYADAVIIVYNDWIVDDWDNGYVEAGGGWAWQWDDDAYQWGARVVAAPTGANTATWTIPVPSAGYYQIYVTWAANLGLAATNAPYSVYDGAVGPGNLEETVLIDQRFDPDDLTYDGQNWERLGSYMIENGQVQIQLTDIGVDGQISADAVMIVYRDWVMGYEDDGTNIAADFDLRMLRFTTHENLMSYPSDEFLIGYQNSVGSLWTIA